MRYTLYSAQGIKLSWKAPFVKFEWLVLELPAANQRVSNSVFSVSSYILVLRFVHVKVSLPSKQWKYHSHEGVKTLKDFPKGM